MTTRKVYVSLSLSHDWNNLSSCFKFVLSNDSQFSSKRKAKHIKIECIGLEPDCGQSARRGCVVMGQLAHVGGWAAHSQARFGPTLVSVVFILLFSEFRDFHDQIPSCCRGVSHPYLFSCIPLCTTCGDKHISKRNKKQIIIRRLHHKALYYTSTN